MASILEKRVIPARAWYIQNLCRGGLESCNLNCPTTKFILCEKNLSRPSKVEK